MHYCFSKTIAGPFDAAVERVRAALAAEGFGVVTDLDMSQTLLSKLGARLAPYRLLGVCDPRAALEVLTIEPRLGVLLPCTLAVRGLASGEVAVDVGDPVVMLGLADAAGLDALASSVGLRLQAVLSRL